MVAWIMKNTYIAFIIPFVTSCWSKMKIKDRWKVNRICKWSGVQTNQTWRAPWQQQSSKGVIWIEIKQQSHYWYQDWHHIELSQTWLKADGTQWMGVISRTSNICCRPPERVSLIVLLLRTQPHMQTNSWKRLLRAEMPCHIKDWGDSASGVWLPEDMAFVTNLGHSGACPEETLCVADPLNMPCRGFNFFLSCTS